MSRLAIAVVATALVFAAFLGCRRWWRVRAHRRTREAMAEFTRRHGDWEGVFLAAASATGKPRGLLWKSCVLDGAPLFARDLTTGEVLALAPATISFEAIAGGDMEEVEAVGNLRSATVVFVHRAGVWTSDGRAVFNLDPQETVARYANSLEPLGELS